MEFSLNYSLEAVELLTRGEVQVDRLKCADWPDMIAEARKYAPIYVHFPYDVGAIAGRKVDSHKQTLAMVRDTDTPFVNFHIVSYARDEVDEAGFRRKLQADILDAVERFERERIIMENIPWFGPHTEFHRWSVDAAIICDAVRSMNVGFLLDLSHARIAAYYLGLDPRNYIESLPVDQLKELHITGVRMHNTRLADHLDLQDEDWSFFEWAMDRIEKGDWPKPWTVAFEYGGIGKPFAWRSHINVIREQVPRLYERVNAPT